MSSSKERERVTEWVGQPIRTAKGNFYEAVMIDSEKITRNDNIFIKSLDPLVPPQIVKVEYMWESKKGNKIIHGTWLWRGGETILGDTSLARELFLVNECQDVSLAYVQSKANVVSPGVSANFTNKGNIN